MSNLEFINLIILFIISIIALFIIINLIICNIKFVKTFNSKEFIYSVIVLCISAAILLYAAIFIIIKLI